MAKILVTGCTGFVGAAFVKYLLSQGHSVVGMGRSAEPPTYDPQFLYLRRDVKLWANDEDQFPTDVDALVHLAWAGSGGPGRDKAELQLENIETTVAAVQLAKHVGASRFIGVGTITEDELNFNEFAPHVTPGPGYVYGLAKATAGAMSRYYASREGLSHVWVKLGNTYGLEDPTKRFFTYALDSMLENKDLDLTSGTQMYDFVYLGDAVAGLTAVALEGQASATYYLGSGEPRPLKDFLLRMAEVTGTKSELNFGTSATAGVSLPAESFSIEVLTQDTSYVPSTTFDEGVVLLMEERQEKKAV